MYSRRSILNAGIAAGLGAATVSFSRRPARAETTQIVLGLASPGRLADPIYAAADEAKA